jgi:hypothetical protein
VKNLQTCRVLILTNSVTGGGAEISMMSLFTSLRENRIEVDLCAINDNGHVGPIQPGVKVLGRSSQSGPVETMRSLRKFAELLTNRHYDLLIANCELPEAFVAFSCSWFKKIIIVEHTSRPWVKRKILGYFVRTILRLRKVSWVTVNSDQKKIWPFNSNAEYIPNPIVFAKEEKTS